MRNDEMGKRGTSQDRKVDGKTSFLGERDDLCLKVHLESHCKSDLRAYLSVAN